MPHALSLAVRFVITKAVCNAGIRWGVILANRKGWMHIGFGILATLYGVISITVVE